MPSPQMQKIIDGTVMPGRKHNLCLDELAPGDSKTIPYSQMSLPVLRTTIYRTGKKLGCKFTVLLHKELELYEIGRMPNETN